MRLRNWLRCIEILMVMGGPAVMAGFFIVVFVNWREFEVSWRDYLDNWRDYRGIWRDSGCPYGKGVWMQLAGGYFLSLFLNWHDFRVNSHDF